ncbi:T9SS type A sorting domain-containing protein [Flavobacterium sp.]|uniref:T9SS type A sorting domain-containing protein n=1 Tax=Flavobacterium sp. TaxID=239 RepID=UPI002614024E|nr:T9SS type A sorting domain-containing protein [Flavobacterium sp.]
MKNFTIFSILFTLMSSTMLGQIYVSNNSYVFNRGSLVYSKGNLELNGANSNFYVRNEGQFLQGTTVGSANTGTGKLSVFQEGTVNNYAYNYWCSPVGNASTAIGNEDFGITMLNVPTTSTASTPVSTTSTSYNGVSGTGTVTIASYWIWRFLSSNGYFQWIQSAALSNIAAGQGFTMKGVSGTDTTNPNEAVANNIGSAQRYDFRGKPNDGTITIGVATGASTLTGNPYPSAIDLNLFLVGGPGPDLISGTSDDIPGNPNCDGTALFWEHDKTVNSHNIAQYRGGYGTYNGTTSIYTPATFYTYDIAGNQGSVFSNPNTMYERRFSPIGQGFMVRGTANGTLQMRNVYRVFIKEGVGNNSQFERSADSNQTVNYGNYSDIPNVAGVDYTQISKAPTPHFIVNTSLNNQAVRQIAIGFLPNAIDGVDLADSKFPEPTENISTDMYLYLNNEPYIHSVTSFDIYKRFSIGFKNANSGVMTYTLKVNEFVNFDVQNVFLYDNLTGLYHDIKNNFYEVVLAPGTHNDRFEITFTDQLLSTINNNIKNLAVVQNNSNQLLSVANPNDLELKSVVLYDITGKLIFNKANLGSAKSYEFSTASLSEGVYVVKIESKDGQSLGQKIIVERLK